MKYIEMSKVNIVIGDLLLSEEKVIVQQLNCLCTKPHGLSLSIAKKYSYANVYGKRRAIGKRNYAVEEDQGIPGEIVVSIGDGPTVIGIYGQYDYGKPGKSFRTPISSDNHALREKWFSKGLTNLATYLNQNGYNRVGFPYNIGCGLAGGNWETYLKMIEDFSEKNNIQVYLYKL